MSKLVRKFWDLEVYKYAYTISLEVHKSSQRFPKSEQYALADQMRRASKSICANLAEGFAKQIVSSKEFKRFVQMALGSATEMQVWVQYAQDLQFIDRACAKTWFEEYTRIIRMLQSLYQKS